MALPQRTIVLLLVLGACASLGHAFDARFLNKSHHTPSLRLFASDVDLIGTKQSNLSDVFINLHRIVDLSLRTETPFQTLSFKIKRRSSETICNVVIEGLLSANPKPKEDCQIADFQIETSADPLFIQLGVNTFTKGGFAIWDLVADGTRHLPISRLTLKSSLERPLGTYVLPRSAVNASTGSVYISLPVDVDRFGGSSNCLALESSIDGAQVETHYALAAWASSNRSVKAHGGSVFCPGEELFLQGLGLIQVTFTVTNIAQLASKEPASLLYFSIFPTANDDAIFGAISLPAHTSSSDTDRWFFYNADTFKYSVTSRKPIRICDMLANCYQMEEVVNGTMGKDGSKQYSVPEKVHSLLKYTPVVRMLTDDHNYESEYFRGRDETVSRVFSHFTSLNLPVQQDGHTLQYTINSTIKPSSAHPNILSLPIHLLDQRTFFFIIILNSPQSDLLLESVSLQFGSGSSLNQSSIPLSLGVGKRLILSSRDFFKLKPHRLPGTQLSNFSLAYRTVGQPEGTEVPVGVTIEVNTIDNTFEPATEDAFSGPEVEFTHISGTGESWHSARSSSDGRVTFSLSKGNSSTLLLSSWIPVNVEPNSDRWNNAQGHLRLSYQAADGLGVFPQKGLRVRQIIWGFANGAYALKEDLQPDAHEEVGNYLFQEIRIRRWLLNDRYRVGYLISLEEKLDRRVKVDFEWNFEEIEAALPRSTLCKGPTYGDVYCRVEPYTCPEHYFKYNPDTGNCEMVN